MQEVLKERRACQNIFDAIDFVCVEYDSYLKARLISLATRKSIYRNGYGVQNVSVPGQVMSIERCGGGALFAVNEESEEGVRVILVDMESGACSACESNCFCVHTSAVACVHPECMVRKLQ